MACSWPEGTCACLGGAIDGGTDSGAGDGGKAEGGTSTKQGTWACAPPPIDESSCPLSAPKVGTSCVKMITCDYGTCVLKRDLNYRCNGHSWTRAAADEECDP